jgi:drug/metabolite transporter (DMT)-like permease
LALPVVAVKSLFVQGVPKPVAMAAASPSSNLQSAADLVTEQLELTESELIEVNSHSYAGTQCDLSLLTHCAADAANQITTTTALFSPEPPAEYSQAQQIMEVHEKKLIFGMTGVYGALLASQMLWSGFHVVADSVFADGSVNHYCLPAIRCFLTFPLLYFTILKVDPGSLKISRADLKQLILITIVGNLLNQQLFNLGLSLSDASDAGMSQPLIPIYTAILARLLGQELINRYKGLGIFCGVMGCVTLALSEQYLSADSSGGSNGKSGSTRALGLLVLALQTLSFSVYILLTKPLLQRLSSLVLTFYMFFFGFFGHLVIAIPFLHTMDWLHLPTQAWIAFLYTAVASSYIAFSLFNYANQNLPPTISSLGITLQPLFSPLLGWIFLGETLTWGHLLGAFFIVSGASLVVYARKVDMEKIKYLQTKGEEEELYSPHIRPENILHVDDSSLNQDNPGNQNFDNYLSDDFERNNNTTAVNVAGNDSENSNLCSPESIRAKLKDAAESAATAAEQIGEAASSLP